jgi:hypothetical protein
MEIFWEDTASEDSLGTKNGKTEAVAYMHAGL